MRNPVAGRTTRESYDNGATIIISDLPGNRSWIFRCPVEGFEIRVTAHPTGPSTDGETIPALFRRFGKRVRGYLMMTDSGPVFVPHPDYMQFIQPERRT